MVIENEIAVLTADGESVPGHRMEFYARVRMVASTRVWAQIMARGSVNLVDRQKDYMERHHQLSPGRSGPRSATRSSTRRGGVATAGSPPSRQAFPG